MEVRSIANNIRVSPQKVRLVVTQIKKMKPADAIVALEYVPQKAAKPLRKAIISAVSNAKNNFGLDDSTLMFSEINIGKGISFKRYRAISRGRAHSILKQTSNIRIVLTGEKTKKVAPVVSQADTDKNKQEVSESKTPEMVEEKANKTKEAKNGTKG